MADDLLRTTIVTLGTSGGEAQVYVVAGDAATVARMCSGGKELVEFEDLEGRPVWIAAHHVVAVAPHGEGS